VIALSVASVLAIFLLYTSLAGGGTPSVAPSELAGKTGEVALAGKVVGTPTGDPHGAGMRFVVEDIDGANKQRVTVLYKGSVPDMFRRGRDVVVTGTQRADGLFVTKPGSMITKCPSKYQAADSPS
jgi:cytochrome c-type biogenesis protein CcmE